MSKPLLLQSSTIFKYPKLIDCIHQSIIDLKTSPPEEEVIILLKDAISYLDTEISFKKASEIFSLILSCFSNFPDASSRSIDQLLSTFKSNSNHLIITASVLSYMVHEYPHIKIPDYESFASDCFSHIFKQIKKSDEKPLKLFKLKIPSKFKIDFIVDIILLTKLNEKIVANIYPYIFSHNSISNAKLNYFISDITKKNLLTIIPESEITKDSKFLNFSNENLSNFILITSKQTFSNILPQIEDQFLKSTSINHDLSVSLIKKCIEYEIKLKSINILIKFLKPDDLSEEFWIYFDKNDIILPENLVEQIVDFPDFVNILKIVPRPEKLPKKILGEHLMKTNDLKIYKHALESDNINCIELSTVDFWNHVVSVVAESENGCSIDVLNRFVYYMENSVKQENFVELFNKIVLDNFGVNGKGSDFLINLLNNINYNYKNLFSKYQNMSELLKSALLIDKIPYFSYCGFFTFNSLPKVDYNNPNILYLYSLQRYCYIDIETVKMMPQTDESIEKLIEFIQTDDFNLIQQMDQNSLSFVACAFCFICSNKFIHVNGLDKNTIIPFLACIYKYIKVARNKIYFHTNEDFLNCIEVGFETLENNSNKLSNVSIDSILLNLNYFCNAKYLSLEKSLDLIEILISIMLKGGYKANKSILFQSIFRMTSNNDPYLENSKLIQKYGEDLFKFAVKNLSEIDNDNLKGFSWDLNCFNDNIIKNIIVNIIENSTNEIIFNTISFLNKYCNFLPEIN